MAGDLTSLGNPQEFYYCEQEILNIAKRTGVECNNIFCVLGNHDIDWSISDLGINVQNVGKEVGKIVKCKYQMIAANCARVKNLSGPKVILEKPYMYPFSRIPAAT